MLLLPATITAQDAMATLRFLTQAMKSEAEGPVVVDGSNLRQFDSSALALLLECRRAAHAWGKSFLLRHPPPKLEALAKLYGVDVLLISAVSVSAP